MLLNKFFSFALLVLFTVSFQVQLSAIHAPENAVVEITQTSNHSPLRSGVIGDENTSMRIRKANGKFHHSGIGRFVSKIKSGIFKNNPPRPTKVKEPGSGLAVAALVLGILGIALFPGILFLSAIPSGLALIFGAISINKYNEGYHERKRMAKAGLILGIIGVAISLVILVLFFSFFFI